jgi:antitoxin component of MazEF toxin-antitoxin module
MKTTVKKLGNSAAVRIPASIEPARQKTYDLTDLLNGITSKNRHEAVQLASPEGKEVW